jgi:hypothetical protein
MKDNVQVMDLFGPIAAKLTQFFQKHKQAEAPAHREGVSAQGSNAGLVTIHTQAGAVVKARRQQDQKIPTSFQFEQEYLMHKDKSKESRIGVCGSGLGSWMSELDGDSSHPPASSAASKPAARPTSLADQLISLRANASSGTPASSRSPAPPTMKSETTPVTVARKDARGTFQAHILKSTLHQEFHIVYVLKALTFLRISGRFPRLGATRWPRSWTTNRNLRVLGPLGLKRGSRVGAVRAARWLRSRTTDRSLRVLVRRNLLGAYGQGRQTQEARGGAKVEVEATPPMAQPSWKTSNKR